MLKIFHMSTSILLFGIVVCVMGDAHAQPLANFPNRTVRLLVGNAPGGGSDVVARALALRLAEVWKGNPVVVENRAGAQGLLAIDAAAKSTPDGYTLLIPSASSLVVPMLQKKITYDVRTAFAPITELTTQMLMLLAHPALPVSTVKETLAYAKANPGKLNLGTGGSGSIAHAGLGLINQSAGLDIQHVPFKGAAPALQALMAGQIQLAFASTIAGMSQVKSGKLKALAVTGARRLRAAPSLPTVAEDGIPGFELTNWYGLYAPAGTPDPVITFLHRDATKIIIEPEMQSKLGGAEATPSASPTQIKERLANEVTKWERLFQIPSFVNSLK